MAGVYVRKPPFALPVQGQQNRLQVRLRAVLAASAHDWSNFEDYHDLGALVAAGANLLYYS